MPHGIFNTHGKPAQPKPAKKRERSRYFNKNNPTILVNQIHQQLNKSLMGEEIEFK